MSKKGDDGAAARAAFKSADADRRADNAAAAKEEAEKGLPPVIPLGEEGETLVFWSRPHRKIYRKKVDKLSPDNLRQMAPLAAYARWLAPDLPPDAVEETARKIFQQVKARLIEETGGRTFDPACVRARGIWPDDETGGVIYNAGNACYLVCPDGTMEEVDGVRGRYVYDAGSTLPAPAADALTNAEGQTLLDFLSARSWAVPAYGELVAGWTACAALAGVLPYRPHVWINAPRNAGKSHLCKDLVSVLEGLVTQHDGLPTPAGLKGKLDSSAIPVILDEAKSDESDSVKGKAKIAGLMDILRSAATSNGGGVLTGTKEQGYKEVIFRNCFLLLSVINTLESDQNESRFLVMNLLSIPERENARLSELQERQEEGRAMVQDASFTPRLLRRLLGAVPDLLKNAQAVKAALRKAGQNDRRSELLGHLMAGAYALTHTGTMTAEALQHAAVVARAVEQAEERTSDTERCLALLLGHSITLCGRHYTVRQLCRMADGADIERREDAERELRGMGMKWSRDKKVLKVNPAKSNTALRKIYAGTDWGDGKITPVLTAGDLDIKSSKTPFKKGHFSTRALLIPAELVFADDEE